VKVEVWRKAVGLEKGIDGKVYVTTGVFLDGARPDVAKQYAAVPKSSRAGWGCQVLTNMLPSPGGGAQGDGQHQFFVYAYDQQGKSTLVGAPTVTVNNSASRRPFGTLDTPASAEVVSGGYTVWGWALTPKPGVIPVNASTCGCSWTVSRSAGQYTTCIDLTYRRCFQGSRTAADPSAITTWTRHN
jgi:hypothetical protein